MIDANLNRAREALRTVEDVARFAWNDAAVAEEAKSLRHALQSAVAAIPPERLALARDVAGDVGTAIAGANEYARGDASSVAVAAGKRLTEALRVIEEAAKTVDPAVARAVEALRYRAYALDARATLRASLSRPRQWRLCVLVTRALCARPWDEVVSLAQGVQDAGAHIISTHFCWHEAPVPTIATMVPRAAFAQVTGRLRQHLRVPVITSNRINMPAVAEAVLARGDADLVSMARPMLADPDLVIKA